jgi:hypothetical protein
MGSLSEMARMYFKRFARAAHPGTPQAHTLACRRVRFVEVVGVDPILPTSMYPTRFLTSATELFTSMRWLVLPP